MIYKILYPEKQENELVAWFINEPIENYVILRGPRVLLIRNTDLYILFKLTFPELTRDVKLYDNVA